MIEVVGSELLSVVQTPAGEKPSLDERDEACRLGFEMRERARMLCPKVGVCAVGVQYSSHEAGKDQRYDLDQYTLVCEKGCPLVLDEAVRVV